MTHSHSIVFKFSLHDCIFQLNTLDKILKSCIFPSEHGKNCTTTPPRDEFNYLSWFMLFLKRKRKLHFTCLLLAPEPLKFFWLGCQSSIFFVCSLGFFCLPVWTCVVLFRRQHVWLCVYQPQIQCPCVRSLLQFSKDYSGRSVSDAPFGGQVLGHLLVVTVEGRQSWCPYRRIVSSRAEYILVASSSLRNGPCTFGNSCPGPPGFLFAAECSQVLPMVPVFLEFLFITFPLTTWFRVHRRIRDVREGLAHP